jgi:subtilase family serine protease
MTSTMAIFGEKMMRSKWKLAICTLLATASSGYALGQSQVVTAAPHPVSRVVLPVDSTRPLTLRGNVHPLARAEFDRGLVDPQLPMNRILLVLKRSADQEAALQAFIAQQQDPKSPNFHHWLTAAEFGQTYGISDQDLAKVTAWLQSEGFSVGTISKGRGTIEFSGTASQVQHTFRTEIHRYVVDGVEHTANNTDPQIPEALAPVVTGVASLHNFFPVSQAVLGNRVKKDTKTGKFVSTNTRAATTASPLAVHPQFSFTKEGAEAEDVTPYDFATIYNLLPLWNAGFKGAGQTIAISGESAISLADVAAFQSSFGLPNNPPTIILNGSGADSGAAVENTLDVEWAGAAAPLAKIVLVVTNSTQNTTGDLLSNEYIVDNQVASVISTSFGTCELFIGTAGNAAYNQVFQQGAVEGISIFVASGDQGSAGCDSHDASPPNVAKYGLQVSGVASSPYVTAVGGTDFNWQIAERTTQGTYWNATNDPVTAASAKGYIPELPWNQSCTSSFLGQWFSGETTPEKLCNDASQGSFDDLVVTVAGSGGASSCTTSDGATVASCTGGYPKPVWQVGAGVPNDSHRDIPDVSLFAASGFPIDHGIPGSAYLICYSSKNHPCNNPPDEQGDIEFQEVGGTSVSSPAMAGIMALVNQKVGSAQGLANPILYQLAVAETSNCDSNTVAATNDCVFYDTTSGNNSLPCLTNALNCVTTTSGDLLGILSGYNAGAGYDLATGLGSVNATNLAQKWMSFVGTTTPPAITVSPLVVPAGQVGVPYSQQFTASGGSPPYTFTALGAPDGLTLSPSGLLSGTPTTANAYTFHVTATDSSAAGPYTGGGEYALTVYQTGAASVITWKPSSTTIFTVSPAGAVIGSGVLDATSSTPGTFSYTASFMGQMPIPVTATSVLTIGTYTLTANLSPTSPLTNTAATASITLIVTAQSVWIVNTNSTLSGLYTDGTAIKNPPNASGNSGISVNTLGNIWVGNTLNSSLMVSDNTGNLLTTHSGSGLNAPAALAADGSGETWVANGNNSISGFTTNGSARTQAAGFTGGNLNTPSGIAVDAAGNIWVSNAGNNSVTEILGIATPTLPIVNAVANGEGAVKP